MSNEYRDWVNDFNNDMRDAIKEVLVNYGAIEEDDVLPDSFVLEVVKGGRPDLFSSDP